MKEPQYVNFEFTESKGLKWTIYGLDLSKPIETALAVSSQIAAKFHWYFDPVHMEGLVYDGALAVATIKGTVVDY